MQHQIEMLQKDVQLYKMAIDSLLNQKQKDHQTIIELNKRVEEKDAENSKLEKMYKEIIISLVDQIKTMGEEAEQAKKINQSLKNTLTVFREKSKKLDEKSYQVRKLKKFIKKTNDILDDVVLDGEDIIRDKSFA